MHQLSYRSLGVVSNIGVTGAGWILPQSPERHPPFLRQDATSAIKTRCPATSNIRPRPFLLLLARHPNRRSPPSRAPSSSPRSFHDRSSSNRLLYKSTSCRCSRFDTSAANFLRLNRVSPLELALLNFHTPLPLTFFRRVGAAGFSDLAVVKGCPGKLGESMIKGPA